VTGGSVTINSEGSHTIEYYSLDVATNQESTKSATCQIDMGGPSVSIYNPYWG